MRFKYQCIREYLSHEDIGEYVSYAIVLENFKVKFSDITTKPEVAKNLTTLLNRHQVNPVHILDILSDIDGTI